MGSSYHVSPTSLEQPRTLLTSSSAQKPKTEANKVVGSSVLLSTSVEPPLSRSHTGGKGCSYLMEPVVSRWNGKLAQPLEPAAAPQVSDEEHWPLRDEALQVFRMGDQNGDNKLDMNELMEICDSFDVARATMDNIDINRDGTVSKAEWLAYIKRLADQDEKSAAWVLALYRKQLSNNTAEAYVTARSTLEEEALPTGYILYWFYRRSSKPDLPLEQGGSAPREDIRVEQVSELIFSQAHKSGNPNTYDQLKEKVPLVAALAYVVHMDSDTVVSVAALEGFLGDPPHNTAEMGMLATDPDHTGRGLAGIVMMKLANVGYDFCELMSFFTVTKVTNYLSLRTQFLPGAIGVTQRVKGISTPVGYATSNDDPAVIYAVLCSPTGAALGSVAGALHRLNAAEMAQCGQLALADLLKADDIKATDKSISFEVLQAQFASLNHEARAALAKVRPREGSVGNVPAIMSEIAGWLKIH